MVRCARGALYTGITSDIERRVTQHNDGKGAKAILALGRPVKLVYKYELGLKSNALNAEALVKSMTRERKEKLILIGQIDWSKDGNGNKSHAGKES